MNRNEFYRNIANSIEKERISLNMTQEQMAKYLEMSLSTYKRMITDANKIDAYVFHKMYNLTNKFMFEFANDDLKHMHFISKLKGLSQTQLQFIESIVDIENRLQTNNNNHFTTLLTFSGDMYDGMIYDSFISEKIEIAEPDIDCAIKVTSNHLHPLYHKGDILLIRQRPPRDGHIGVFVNTESGRLFIRKFYQTQPCKLEPISKLGESFYVDQYDEDDMNKWIKFGYVVKKVR